MSNDPFVHLAEVVKLTSKEGVVNYMSERIARFEEQIGKRPDYRDPLNADAFQRWRDLCLVWLGRVAEATSLLGSLQLLPPDEAQRLKLKALALINRAQEAVVMGQ
jgi:hypothetical protein